MVLWNCKTLVLPTGLVIEMIEGVDLVQNGFNSYKSLPP
jgi:hypothetical protein